MKRQPCFSNRHCRRRRRQCHARQSGISLVELMVGMVVGLLASLVIVQTFSSSEMFRRNLSGAGDATQAAAIVAQRLDLVLQEAGAGLARGSHVWGCQLLVNYAGTAILPRPDPFPSPFGSVPQKMRAVPLAIVDGGTSGSDVLVVMAGDSAAGNRPIMVSSTGSSLVVKPTPALGMGLKAGADASLFDMFLTVPQDVPDDPGDCRLVQAQSTFSPATLATDSSIGAKIVTVSNADIPLNGMSYGNVDSGILTKAPAAFHLGLRNAPTFALLGVNGDGELVQFDILNRSDPQVLGENVFLIKARYGLDDGVGGTDNDNAVDEWVSPSESGWTIANVLDGKLATQQKIGYIKAVRIAVVMRSAQPFMTDAPITELNLFQDLPEKRRFKRSLSADEQRYQYQVYEWVIPLRNMKVPPNV
ncbi:MAG: PilW family protein [Proteobacteria bacterium]|nr:PilW family protein [Pseudomonadota bacterium]